MKKISVSLFIVLIVAFSSIQARAIFEHDANCVTMCVPTPNGNYPILDLTIDPVNPEGVTPSQAAVLMSLGYYEDALPLDIVAEVSFVDEDGVGYTQTGIVLAGTSVWVQPGSFGDLTDPDWKVSPGIYLAVCSNVYSYWRWQVRAAQ